MSDTIMACPECDATGIMRLNDDPRGGTTAEGEYGCQRCGARFDDPDEREPYHTATDHNGPGTALLDADPGDWP